MAEDKAAFLAFFKQFLNAREHFPLVCFIGHALAAVKRKHSYTPAFKPLAYVHYPLKKPEVSVKIVAGGYLADRRAESGQAYFVSGKLFMYFIYLPVVKQREVLTVHAAQFKQRDPQTLKCFKLTVEITCYFVRKR